MKLETMKAVYSYFFPEVRPLMRFGDKIPDEIYLTSTSAEKAQNLLGNLFRTPLKVPATLDGKIDLDGIHEPVIDKVVDAHSHLVPSLKDFLHRYPTPGSSQGIFNLLSLLKTKGTDEIYVLKGEYEGFAEYGKTIGIKTIEVSQQANLEKLKPGYWFISNPSARDGNIIPNKFIEDLCDGGHKVILDLAYAGSTKPHEFDVGHENIPAVLMSFSKPYGVFRFRIGFTFSREPIDSLYANKWFKDVPRLLTAVKIVEELPPGSLYPKYNPIQKQIIDQINGDFNLEMRASDALLLGHLPKESAKNLNSAQKELITPFQRGDGYRFCLTPYFEKLEAMK